MNRTTVLDKTENNRQKRDKERQKRDKTETKRESTHQQVDGRVATHRQHVVVVKDVVLGAGGAKVAVLDGPVPDGTAGGGGVWRSVLAETG